MKKTIPDAGASEIKSVASEMVREEVLELLSTGSSTMYGLKGRGISVEKSGDDWRRIRHMPVKADLET